MAVQREAVNSEDALDMNDNQPVVLTHAVGAYLTHTEDERRRPKKDDLYSFCIFWIYTFFFSS